MRLRDVTKVSLFLLLLISIFIGGTSNAYALIDEWNSDFSADGIVAFGPNETYDYYGYGSALQSDGKLLVTGTVYDFVNYYSNILILRYNTDGTLDDTFGSGGIVEFDQSDYDEGYDCTIQPDGKILVTGTVSVGGIMEMTVLRYLTDGTLDNNFGTAGSYKYPNEGSDGKGYTLELQPNGNILVGGYLGTTGRIWQLTSAGALDETFGTSGSFSISDLFLSFFIRDLAIQPNSSILFVGEKGSGGSWNAFLGRITDAGISDTTFSEDGYVYPEALGYNTGVLVLDGGKIATVGYISTFLKYVQVTRYTQSGELDLTFNGTGYVQIANAKARGISLLAGGGLVIAGETTTLEGRLWAYDSNGVLDEYFGTNGVLSFLNPGENQQYVTSIEFNPSTNRFYVTGYAFDITGYADVMDWSYRYAFQVDGLSSLSAYDSLDRDVEVSSAYGAIGEATITVRDGLGNLVAEAIADFTHDLDWSAVTGETDLLNNKAVITNLTNADGVSSHSLYVPKETTDDRLGYCPLAATLAEVSSACTGYTEMQLGDPGLSIVADGGFVYWKVTGPLIGSGGFSFRQQELGGTGQPILLFSGIGILMVTPTAIMTRRRLLRETR